MCSIINQIKFYSKVNNHYLLIKNAQTTNVLDRIKKVIILIILKV